MLKRSLLLIFCIALINSHLAHADLGRPRMDKIKAAAMLVPLEYQKDVLITLKKSGRNAWELFKAIQDAAQEQREGMAFLIANMPGRDFVALKADFLIENIKLAYQAMNEVPWGKGIPKDIFLNNVLPYAILNERRDHWRKDLHDRFIDIAQESKAIDRAVLILNKYIFEELKVAYSATKRPKPDQSPYESVKAGYASCTGLSILLTDALRSVGIPARIAGIPLWADESGNHTWVEIWDGQWHYIGASESTELDHAWFSQKAAQTDKEHPIYATSFKKTGLSFPMVWAPGLRFVSAENITENYKLHSK